MLAQHSKFDDGQLHRLALSFQDLPELEWTAGPFGDGIIDGETRVGNLIAKFGQEGGPKRIQQVPRSNNYCVRFVFRKARVYLAYANHDRLDELLRFADALAHELWPYRERGASLPMKDSDFNFSLRETQIYIEEWRLKRPDVIELIQLIIGRLKELDLIKLPEERAKERYNANVHSLTRTRTLSGRIESVIAYQNELHEQMLDEKVLAVQTLVHTVLKEISSLRELVSARLDGAELRQLPSDRTKWTDKPIN